jgi:hypothetical protein
MKRRWLVLAVSGVSCGALAVAACGGGDDSSPGGGSADATSESAPGVDAAEDSPAADSPAIDSPTTTLDATTSDAGADASDAGADGSDAGVDASDAALCAAFDASGLDEASVAAGFEQVWQVYHCAACHQKSSQVIDDAGHGIALSGNNNGTGDSGMIFPPNLTNDPATGLGCWTDSQIENAMLHGIANDGRMLCPPMPKFGSALTTADGGPRPGYPMDSGTAQEIIDFLRSLPVVDNQVPRTSCTVPDGGTGTPADAATDGPIDAPGQ